MKVQIAKASLGLAALLVLITWETSAQAQTTPDVLFTVQVGTICGGTDRQATLTNPPSWNCSSQGTGTENRYSYTATSKGQSGSGTLTATVIATVNISSPPLGGFSAQTLIAVYARAPSTYFTVTVQPTVALNVSGQGERATADIIFSLTEERATVPLTQDPSSAFKPIVKVVASDTRSTLSFGGTTYYHVANVSLSSEATGGERGATASASTTAVISVAPTQKGALAGRGLGDGPSIPAQCTPSPTSARGLVNPQSGTATAERRDPVATRGYPVATNIYINSQSKFPTLLTPIGLNGAFTYGIAIRTGSDGIRYLIGEDGSEFAYGQATGPPTAEPGVYAQLSPSVGGWSLSGAGPPARIHRAGNFRYDFDAAGRLLQITDPSGNAQQVAYDKSGNPTQVTDGNTGKNVRFEYDSPGLIARIIENGGSAISRLSYVGNRLTDILLTDQIGSRVTETSYAYDPSGRLSSLTADSNPATKISWSYTIAGQGVSLANMSWTGITTGSTGLSYLSAPQPGNQFRAAQTNSLGGTTNYDYDASGNLVRIEFPTPSGASGAPVVKLSYDGNRNLISSSDGSNTRTYAYNASGEVTRVLDGAGGEWDLAYQANGVDLISITDSIGTVLTLDYGDPANPHSPTSSTDGAGNAWTKTYNAFGQVLSVNPPSGSPTGQTNYTYEETAGSSSLGYLKQIVNGAADTITFDAYSPLGDLTSLSTSPRDGVINTTRFQYDAAQRLTNLIHPDSTRTQWAYTGRDLGKTTDENGTATSYDTCAVCGALEAVHAPLSKTLQLVHSADHDIAAFIDARSNKTSYVYGKGREPAQVKYPDGTTESFAYDTANRLQAITNGRGQKATPTYDAAGRLQRISFSNGQPDISYTYFADGRLQTMKDEAGTTTYAYTSNRLTSTITYDYAASGLSDPQALSYSYNPDNTVNSLTWTSSGSTVATWNYGYDAAGRLSSVSNGFGDSSTYAYDHEGKITGQTNSNGTTETYAYNEARGWPASITWQQGASTLSSYAFTFDKGATTVGDLTQVVEADGGQVAYGYDALDRLTSESRGGAYSNTFGYDLAGNITTKNGSTFASYDSGNKFAAIPSGTATYDADGNLNSVSGAASDPATFTWDARSKLRSQTSGGTITSYKYDGSGRRSVRSGEQVTFYVFSGSTLIGEVTGGIPSVAYTWGADGLASERLIPSGRTLFYHFGPQGETRQLTDGSGAVADTYSYEAYGKQFQSAGSDSNAYRYGGKFGYYADGGSGLMLAGARWYNPNLMRWSSRDPIGYAGGDNQFAYVGQDPINAVDPSGRDIYWVTERNWPHVHDFLVIDTVAGPFRVDFAPANLGSAALAGFGLPVPGQVQAKPFPEFDTTSYSDNIVTQVTYPVVSGLPLVSALRHMHLDYLVWAQNCQTFACVITTEAGGDNPVWCSFPFGPWAVAATRK